MWFDGVPVLFLPGNSGSHMQARSLASVALRMSISRETDYHFDFFTISFNEEVSALYGGVLGKQTKFAAASINAILDLYKENQYRKSVPTSVILIGHSMGGVIAKRLLAWPGTINKTNIAIALAAPLEAPVVNFDFKINDFYMDMDQEWNDNVRLKEEVKEDKMLLSFGGGPRDVLVPSGLTTDKDSYINALTTSIPGVWVSPDHVGIVWCKQLVMAINRFLFSIVNPSTEQVYENMDFVKSKAKMYFESNRSMSLNPRTAHANATMTPDAFWYEDNRRVYQILRPEIDKMTYLMIRLVQFPQNRFVAVETVNTSDRDWVFGCNAKDVFNTHRYCESATSLSELSRWTGSVSSFGKRKLATINLHSLSKMYPDWTHVVVKVSPTRKPVILNVDINDYTSRQITVDLSSPLNLGELVVIRQTEPESLYYEIILNGFKSIQQAYLLHIKPTPDCKASQYHVSAELHVPWAKNNEAYHYFTHVKKSPMKLRLFRSKDNSQFNGAIDEPAKVTILLDPLCTFSVRISVAWYHRLAQIARHYTPILIPYMGGILLLALRNTYINIRKHGVALPVHIALTSRVIHPHFCVSVITVATMALGKLEPWAPFFVTAGWMNREIHVLFVETISVLLIYMAALGILYVAAAVIQIMLMFSSQVTHKFFFRIVSAGAVGFAERIASGLQKVPLVVSITLMMGATLSCGGASLVAGAAFYAFMLSKMYEEYLEDYVYNKIVKFASRMCCLLVRSRRSPREDNKASGTNTTSEDKPTLEDNPDSVTDPTSDTLSKGEDETKAIQRADGNDNGGGDNSDNIRTDCDNDRNVASENDEELKEQLNSLNYHMLLFLLWLMVTIINLPALITWARNFNENPLLKFDTSGLTGMLMSVCTVCLFQMRPPKKNLYFYNLVIHMLLIMAMIVFILGPTALYVVSQVITLIFTLIASQQMLDKTVDGVFIDTYFTDNRPQVTYTDLPINDNELEINADNENRDDVAEPSAGSSTAASSTGASSSTTSCSTETSASASSPGPSSSSASSPSAESTSAASSNPSPSTSNDRASNPALDECDENSIMYKIKMLKEKLSFLEHT
ncbi:hypothetical protein O3G_MSEX003858 [Manduca sexta]|uniref:GPI inositol-deacylase n=1 Tax=Manduca sexta TaxID=7130 RepID=A0A921YTS5_MANSE|nr:hypothetical protein O3G_MSEX003858 [Manduca sexta]